MLPAPPKREVGIILHVRRTSGGESGNTITTHLPLLSADAVQVRETAKLSGVIEWVQGQLLHMEKSWLTIHSSIL